MHWPDANGMQQKNNPPLAHLITAVFTIAGIKGIYLGEYSAQTFHIKFKGCFYMDLLGCQELFACQYIWHSI